MKKLQDDLFIPEDFSENHHYYADDKGEREYTGITTILAIKAKPALIPWAVKMCADYIDGFIKECAEHADWAEMIKSGQWDELVKKAKAEHTKKKEKAGEHGTDVHALVENYINVCINTNEGKPIAGGDVSIAKFIDWAIENVDHFLYSERPVHSKSLYLAGTIDAGAVMKDGTRRVIDLKTGSGIYYEAILQCELYQMLAEEEGDEKYGGSVIVNLKKDGKFEVQVRGRSKIDEEAARGALALYRGDKSFIKK